VVSERLDKNSPCYQEDDVLKFCFVAAQKYQQLDQNCYFYSDPNIAPTLYMIWCADIGMSYKKKTTLSSNELSKQLQLGAR